MSTLCTNTDSHENLNKIKQAMKALKVLDYYFRQDSDPESTLMGLFPIKCFNQTPNKSQLNQRQKMIFHSDK